VTSATDEPLAADDRGNSLISFAWGHEAAPPQDAPLPAALVALWRTGRVLMVFDRHRQSWELPGGSLEGSESPRQAAERELLEETGQQPDERLRFIGYARFVLAPDRRTEYLALYAGFCTEPRPFEPTEEIADIHWWDLHAPLPGHVQHLDIYLAALTQQTGGRTAAPTSNGPRSDAKTSGNTPWPHSDGSVGRGGEGTAAQCCRALGSCGQVSRSCCPSSRRSWT
jgi:8-oxo-dGTP diphosphatase